MSETKTLLNWLDDLVDSGDLEPILYKAGEEELRLKFYRLRQLREKRCSDERPCINCFSDQGGCLGPYHTDDAPVIEIFPGTMDALNNLKAPNGEVRGASPDGEAYRRGAATSTVMLERGGSKP